MNITSLHNTISPNKNIIYVNPKIQKISTICSNPLMRNTKVCTVFWYEMNKFNTKTLDMEYEVTRTFNHIRNEHISEQMYSYFDTKHNCNDINFSSEECRIYDN